jgi:YfiH family protein
VVEPAAAGTEVVVLPGGVVAAWSDRSAGDLRPVLGGQGPDRSLLARFAQGTRFARGSSASSEDVPVIWLRQVHGDGVVVVGPGADPSGTEGDALVAPAGTRAALAVLTADCGSVALAGDDGSAAAVHAGWRGVAAGVVDRAVEALVAEGATRVSAAFGPCVHPCCYAFSADDLDAVANGLGPSVRGVTATGEPALDLPAALTAALSRSGAELVSMVDRCTACSGRDFSHRARRDHGRQALVVWPGGAERGAG